MCKRILPGIFGGLGILLLIFDSKTALYGARDGIDLCIASVIPSIFPFLILSGMLTRALRGSNLPFLRPLSTILGIPHGSEVIFLTGMIGGYPTGAQAVHQAWKNGMLTKADAQRMLAFCSNAGPSFIFGILGAVFSDGWMLWLLWGIHILSAICSAIIFPGKSRNYCKHLDERQVPLAQSIKNAVITMGCICGWVVLFRILLAFLDRWIFWILPENDRVFCCGLLELANGCCSAELIAPGGLRFIICSAILAFGGVCVAMQTASVIGELRLNTYMQGKTLQTIISILLSAIAQSLLFPVGESVAVSEILPVIASGFAMLFLIIPVKYKNRGSIPAQIGV